MKPIVVMEQVNLNIKNRLNTKVAILRELKDKNVKVSSMIDRIIAVLLLLFFSPILMVAFLLLLVEDGFPLIFKQQRVGRNDKDFYIYKIRSMRRNTPQVSTNELSNPEKYRLKTGKFFRKYSIDELPNLWNIVKGDMHFIGPRPLMRREKELHALRLKYGILEIKPGITGFAQVNGRDIMSVSRKVALERHYKQNRSLRLKAFIIAKTAVIVLRAVGVKF